jgi:perosamine synthetase
MTWPNYSKACREDVDTLLRTAKSLTGYRSNKLWGLPPCDWSWAHKFERELEKRLQAKHAVAVNSGTMALEAALHALDLPPGSDIVTSPYTFSATPASILLSGHRPVFADVDPYSYCITPESVAKVITRKTRAIMPVDLFGGVADYKGFAKFGLPIISDHCQAVGAKVDGKYTFGDITACSGNGGKNLPMGEGGFCLTDDKMLAERMRLFISHGENFDAPVVGRNGRLPELTAIVAYHGLLELEERNERRRQLVDTIYGSWMGKGDAKFIVAPYHSDRIPWGRHENPKRAEHVYYVVPALIRGMDREKFIQRMKRKGMACSGQYTRPLHTFPALRKYAPKPMPVVEELAYKTLCLISDLTPDKPLSYAKKVAQAMKESLA